MKLVGHFLRVSLFLPVVQLFICEACSSFKSMCSIFLQCSSYPTCSSYPPCRSFTTSVVHFLPCSILIPTYAVFIICRCFPSLCLFFLYTAWFYMPFIDILYASCWLLSVNDFYIVDYLIHLAVQYYLSIAIIFITALSIYYYVSEAYKLCFIT